MYLAILFTLSIYLFIQSHHVIFKLKHLIYLHLVALSLCDSSSVGEKQITAKTNSKTRSRHDNKRLCHKGLGDKTKAT